MYRTLKRIKSTTDTHFIILMLHCSSVPFRHKLCTNPSSSSWLTSEHQKYYNQRTTSQLFEKLPQPSLLLEFYVDRHYHHHMQHSNYGKSFRESTHNLNEQKRRSMRISHLFVSRLAVEVEMQKKTKRKKYSCSWIACDYFI